MSWISIYRWLYFIWMCKFSGKKSMGELIQAAITTFSVISTLTRKNFCVYLEQLTSTGQSGLPFEFLVCSRSTRPIILSLRHRFNSFLRWDCAISPQWRPYFASPLFIYTEQRHSVIKRSVTSWRGDVSFTNNWNNTATTFTCRSCYAVDDVVLYSEG